MSAPPIELSPTDWQILCDLLQRHVPDQEVWAFGPRVRRTAKPYSDVDLAILTERPLASDLSAALAEDFAESDLPFKVDVVDWATTSEPFRNVIRREYVVLQASKPGEDR